MRRLRESLARHFRRGSAPSLPDLLSVSASSGFVEVRRNGRIVWRGTARDPKRD